MTFRLGIGADEATLVRVTEPDELPAALRAAGLPTARPVVVVVGGAGGLGVAQRRRMTPVFTDALVPAIARTGATAVDGGTDAGVMRLLGEGRASSPARFRLVGVAAEGTVQLPGGEAVRRDAAQLEPHHTHFVLVPGDEWGAESSWIARTATCLAGPAPSVTVLVNGGDIAYADAARSLAAGRPLLVIAGSGRAADQIAAALRGGTSDPRAQQLAASGAVTLADIQDPAQVYQAVTSALGWPSSSQD
ncbi:MAG: hypothetical protein ACOYBY_16735 [Dermatophilaceae bacterium]